ncbi:MAG: hypothetical protein ABI846_04730 [Rudaea sp.]
MFATLPGRRVRACLLAAGLLASGLLANKCAFADDGAQALDRVSLWLGGYSLDTKVSVDARNAAGDISTGKVDLDSGNETVGRARIDFLVFDSQGFSFDYFTLDNSTSRVLSKPFTFEGLPFQLDSTIHAKLDLAAGSASYHWWFGSASDIVGIGVGGSWYKLKVGIDGKITLNAIEAEGGASWQDDAVAPLVTIAYKHAFSDGLRVYLDASGVRKNAGKLTGHIYDGRVGVEWFPWRHFGVGAEYGITHIHVNHDGESYLAAVDVKFSGPSLFGRMRF